MGLMDDLIGAGESDSGRRMLIFLLLDTSRSMHGAPLEAVKEGIHFLRQELRKTPEAIELAHICIITFSDNARVVMPLTGLLQFTKSPELQANGGTNMSAALDLVNVEINRHFRPNKGGEVRGDYKPMIFLLTDGEPNDLPAAILAGQAIQNRPSGQTVGTFLALGCGPQVNADNLKRIAKNVAIMQYMNPDNLRQFFAWMTASIAGASRRASQVASGAGEGGDMAPPDIPKNEAGEAAFKFEF